MGGRAQGRWGHADGVRHHRVSGYVAAFEGLLKGISCARAVGGLDQGLQWGHADGVHHQRAPAVHGLQGSGSVAIEGLLRGLCACAQWVGWIKDYDGGTLMECVINERLPYTGFPAMIAAQRAALDRHIRALSNAHVVRPGLAAFGLPGPGPAVPNGVAIADIPGGQFVPPGAGANSCPAFAFPMRGTLPL